MGIATTVVSLWVVLVFLGGCVCEEGCQGEEDGEGEMHGFCVEVGGG